MVWNFTKPEIKPVKSSKKLTLQDFQAGDRVRVLEDTQPVWGQPGIPAGTELEVVDVGSYWVEVKNKQKFFIFYDPAATIPHPLLDTRTLDNLAKVE